jgi:GNAT superfamily N-acetyltransferase
VENARIAIATDLPDIVALAEALITELAPTRGGDVWARREAPPARLRGYFESHIDDDARSLIVGTIDDITVGFVTVQRERLRDGTDLGVIAELYVDPEARAIGVGEVMVNLAVEWCETVGCFGIDARALPGNRAAKNFFEMHGFVARSITMHRPSGR